MSTFENGDSGPNTEMMDRKEHPPNQGPAPYGNCPCGEALVKGGYCPNCQTGEECPETLPPPTPIKKRSDLPVICPECRQMIGATDGDCGCTDT